jgi:hypothetical protein
MEQRTQTQWQKVAAARMRGYQYDGGDGDIMVVDAATQSYRLFDFMLHARRWQKSALYRQIIRLDLPLTGKQGNPYCWERDTWERDRD